MRKDGRDGAELFSMRHVSFFVKEWTADGLSAECSFLSKIEKVSGKSTDTISFYADTDTKF